jgi:predicted acetyltransferase
MIQLANQYIRPSVRNIWKEVFGDEDAYMDLFFAEKYKDENTLVAVEDNRVVASLQMLPYEITFYGFKVPLYYLAGLSTLPDYRNLGLMAQLLLESHELMLQRQIPLSVLVPAEESLFAYYSRFGYAQTFKKNYIAFEFSVKEIWENSRNENESYQIFDKTYNQHDFCVQKSFSDFKTIIQLENDEGFQPKHNLSGLARIIDPELLLDLYAQKHPENKFLVELQDIQFGKQMISVENGSAKVITDNLLPDFTVDEKLLIQLLFGFETNLKPEPFCPLFPKHNPIMNYMLE